eukprot:scaffold281565_cov21-Tisochrysis_lutea.AAC.1
MEIPQKSALSPPKEMLLPKRTAVAASPTALRGAPPVHLPAAASGLWRPRTGKSAQSQPWPVRTQPPRTAGIRAAHHTRTVSNPSSAGSALYCNSACMRAGMCVFACMRMHESLLVGIMSKLYPLHYPSHSTLHLACSKRPGLSA